MKDSPSYFKYWGKAKAETDGGMPDYHLLVYHCLDVAAVVDIWLQSSTAILNSFMAATGLNEDETIAWILFFVALHDYGKFDLRFQRKAEPVWNHVNLEISQLAAELSRRVISEYYHGPMGLEWFYQDLKERFELDDGFFIEQSDDWGAWHSWFGAVAGHHGYIEETNCDEGTSSLPYSVKEKNLIEKTIKDARIEWLSALETLFLKPAGLLLSDNPPLLKTTKNNQSPATMLAGFCAVSDWLGSSDYFPYDNQETTDLLHWYQSRTKYAKRALNAAGVISRIKPYQGIQSLLGDYSPRQLQCLMGQLPQGKGFTLIEASTGSGKTEFALAYAWQLIAAGLADSIVFALPTQATANAMLRRLENFAPLLFENQSNMILSHGRAKYNENFIQLKQACRPCTVQGREEALVQCGEWLSQSRKRVFLGQIGVCTIDQVLISVLPIKHKFVRGFGIGRSVLIIDEVHAYDAYMYGLIDAVLEQQRLADGSVILLSATLPWYQKHQLAQVWKARFEKSEKPEEIPYPLITYCSNSNEKPGKSTQLFDLQNMPDQQPVTQTVKTELIYSEQMQIDDGLLDMLLASVEQGVQICLICNLVDIAQITYQRALEKLKKIQKLSEDQLFLFHSRYTYTDRQDKEIKVLKIFGLDSLHSNKPNKFREKGHLLIATQVVEQSLDIDFDWMITQLCPADLLFQRMGRLHRHEHNLRPAGFEQPRCTVLLPTSLDYHWHSLIYGNSRVLWRTQQLLEKTHKQSSGNIEFPSSYRKWVEPVYHEGAWPDEPDQVIKDYEEFIRQKEASYFTARQIIRRNANLRDNDSNIAALTRDGEMSLNIIPVYANSQGEQCLLDHQVVNRLSDAKKFEALNLNTVSVPRSWGRVNCFPDADQDGFIWLGMHQNKNGNSAEFGEYLYHYHEDTGLQRIEKTEKENV